MARRIRRELIRVDSGLAEREIEEERQRIEAEKEEQEREEQRRQRRRSSFLWQLFSGSFLVGHHASQYYNYLIAIAAMCFLSIFVTFMSLNADKREARDRGAHARAARTCRAVAGGEVPPRLI